MIPVSIPRDSVTEDSYLFEQLRRDFLELSQKLAGQVWTDYNPHDPGVTILEQLCFALTDLEYRTGTPLSEIIQAAASDWSDLHDQALFDPAEILPCAPLSPEDYRALLIDRMPELSNAWVEPNYSHPLGFRGIWEVLLQADQAPSSDEEAESLKQRALELLLQHRNLCEDFESVEILRAERIAISADLEISPEVVGESLLAQLYLEIEQYLSPPVKFYSLQELLDKGMQPEDIFQGPLPKRGFILHQELPPLPSEFYLSKLLEIISEVPGVMKVRGFTVRKNGIEVDEDVLVMDRGVFPALDVPLLDTGPDPSGLDRGIRLWRGDLPYPLNRSAALQSWFSQKVAREGQSFGQVAPQRTKSKPSLSPEQIGEYVSVQHFFPSIYGLGLEKLGGNPGHERQAYVRQLRGYLLVFEQFLADYLYRLQNLRNVFSLARADEPSEGLQVPLDVPFLTEVLLKEHPEGYKKSLLERSAHFAAEPRHKLAFLRHLLARFGETPPIAEVAGQSPETLARRCADLLSDYIALSRDRAKGIGADNQLLPAIQRRINLLANIGARETRTLAPAFDKLLYETTTVKLDDTNRRESTFTDAYQQWTGSTYRFPDDAEEPSAFVFAGISIDGLLAHGTQRNHYRIAQNEDGRYALLFRPSAHQDITAIFTASDEDTVRKNLERLLVELASINASCEGFHLVENILLRTSLGTTQEFQLLDDNERVILVSYAFADFDTIKNHVDDLLLCGIQRENYEPVADGASFSFLLRDNTGGFIGRSAELFDTAEDAEEAIKIIIDYLAQLRHSNTSIHNRISYNTERSQGQAVSETFFSQRVSFVLPAWPARFQDPNFRQVFRQIAGSCLPAHIGADYFWLSPSEMRDFEALHEDWLEAIAQGKTQEEESERLAASLAQFLVERLPQSDNAPQTG